MLFWLPVKIAFVAYLINSKRVNITFRCWQIQAGAAEEA